MKLLKKNWRSLGYVSGLRFRQWQTRRYRRRVEALPIPPLAAKPLTDFRLLLFCGEKQAALAQQCLWSIHLAWNSIPPLKLVSDGTISPEGLLQATAFWPAERTAEDWTLPAQRQQSLGRKDLANFAQQHILGRKLAAIVDAAQTSPVLFCDSDILWFGGPPPLPAKNSPQTPVMRMASDVYRHYDEKLIEVAGLSKLNESPWLNSGVVYLDGDLYAAAQMDRLLAITAKEPHYFSEQTTLAWMCRSLGFEPWTREQIALVVDDQYWPLRPNFRSRRWMARHYVGDVRHWFWRDALELHKNS